MDRTELELYELKMSSSTKQRRGGRRTRKGMRLVMPLFSDPVQFKNNVWSTSTYPVSFSATFVFAIVSATFVFAFVIAPTRGLPGAESAKYCTGKTGGKAIQVWVEYNGSQKQLNVTIDPVTRCSFVIPVPRSFSFKINGEAQELDISSLPELPEPKEKAMMLKIVSIIIPVFVFIAASLGIFFFLRNRKFTELVEDWEEIYGTHRFSFKATNGFGEKEIVGKGDFSEVYQGTVSIGQLQHRNLATLWLLQKKGRDTYSVRVPALWKLRDVHLSRFRIIKGVTSGLVYLHEEWDKVVIHRDVKASNVFLDAEMNPRLGNFGLAMLFDHGSIDTLTSKIAGTPGYIAPEMNRSGLASTRTDVYAFGVFLLEVTCEKRPVEMRTNLTGVRSIYPVDLVLDTCDSQSGVQVVWSMFGELVNLCLLRRKYQQLCPF
ncbi:hypothetical protein C5167_004140 [Papaver somniferum]|nr:hypothetical protein C5167_004140 [Papaver somniferum]